MKNKIALVYNSSWYLYHLRRDFIQFLQDKGFEVVAICPGDEATPLLKDMGIRWVDLNIKPRGTNPWRDFQTFIRLYRVFKKEQPNMVFNYTIKPIIYGSLAAKLTGIRPVFSMVPGRGSLYMDRSDAGRLLRKIVLPVYRTALKSNKRVYFQNKQDKKLFLKTLLIGKDQAVVMNGSGVNLQWFQPEIEKTRPQTFLLMARLLKEKGILEYVDAARRLREKYPQARFNLLGPLETGKGAIKKKQIDNWREEGVIQYLGKTVDVRPHIAECEVFVLPSYYREGLPKSLLEALAMGKPVITTNWPGCREVVVNKSNGYLVPIKDPVALADAMERFLADPGLSKRMGLDSRQMAVNRFDVNHVNEILFTTMLS